MPPEISENELEKTQSILEDLLGLLGFSVTVTPTEEQNSNCFSIDGAESPGRLIGRKGRTLFSLETLLNRILRKQDHSFPWMEVDVDGYRSKKRGEKRNTGPKKSAEEIRAVKMAREIAAEVKRWGESRTVGPLERAERRAVHQALKDDDEIETESGEEQKDGRKNVAVRIAGADE